MADGIVIRELQSMADLNATVALQKAVWRMRDVEVASPHTFKAIAHSGGGILGAESGGRLVGFCAGFAALRGEQLLLWSHMAGVHPAYQGRGIGFRLKQAQRQWALNKGFRLMAWTFDPLQSGNANFNFNRLGARARHYSPNHYGAMQDSINAGMASDRLEAQWQLDAPQVIALAGGQAKLPCAQPPDASAMALREKGGELRYQQLPANEGLLIGVEIPLDIAALKRRDPEKARQWQLHVRRAMTEFLAAGYIVSAFQRQGAAAWYLLSKRK